VIREKRLDHAPRELSDSAGAEEAVFAIASR
jgi:hypothetical protein